MRAATPDTTAESASGVLERIDLIDRQVTVRQENGAVTYSSLPGCEVFLNGERVKLQMLQPRDHVRVAYRRRPEGRLALSLEAVTRPGRVPSVDRDG